MADRTTEELAARVAQLERRVAALESVEGVRHTLSGSAGMKREAWAVMGSSPCVRSQNAEIPQRLP
jgi:hypothetical protein